MRTELALKAQHYFAEHFKTPLDTLLSPIDEAQPGGKNLRSNGVYRAIQEARRQDDPSLPQGAWERELKRADWSKVAEIAVDALAKKSKDLQLAVWLLEAQIQRHGFGAIAPCLVLIELLCTHHWQHLYPPAEEDLEHRANVFHWANEKLLPVLRLIPLSNTGRDVREFAWADWEQAKRNEQLKSARGQVEGMQGITTLEFAAAMAGSGSEWHLRLYHDIGDALASIEVLSHTLNELCQDEAPGLHALTTLLEQIQTLISSELHKRGIEPNAIPIEETATAETPVAMPAHEGGPIRDRATAYAQLAVAADYLMRVEPHSPAPYLVRRAIAWGNLNTAELYQELFVRLGGQLNIFEVLGINVPSASE